MRKFINKTKGIMMVGFLLALIFTSSTAYAARGDGNGRQQNRQASWSNIIDNFIQNDRTPPAPKDDTKVKPPVESTTTTPVVVATTTATSTATTTPAKTVSTSTNAVAGTSVGLRSLKSIAGTMDKIFPLSTPYDSGAFSAPLTWLLSLIALISGIAGIILAAGRNLPTIAGTVTYFKELRTRLFPETATH